MTTHFFKSDTFYILSGPSASGKSFFTNQLLEQGLPSDAIVSTDSIRKSILGFKEEIDRFGVREVLYGWDNNQPEIFNIIEEILDIRFKQKLPTVFDATNLSDKERSQFVKIATRNHIKSHIVIIDTDVALLEERLSKRKERFDFSVVQRQLEKFQKDSLYPFSLISAQDTFVYNPSLINTSNVVVVGDTHGLLNATLELLQSQGFTLSDKGFYHPEKKVVFLGDVVDRGEHSLELLTAVMHTVEHQNGYFLLGNHENKLIQSYSNFLKDGTVKGKSVSSSQTLMKFLALDDELKDKLFNFLQSTPSNLNLWVDRDTLVAVENVKESSELVKIGMIHAHANSYNPFRIPKSEAIYGYTRLEADHDCAYEDNYRAGINKYILLRGHIKETSQQDHVFSLEDNQAFMGSLVSLDMKKFLELLKNNNFESKYSLFEKAIMKKETNYDYNETIKDNVALMKGLSALHKEGLVTNGVRTDPHTKEKIIPEDGLKIFKYAKKVHFKRLWKTNPLFEKARGLVLDDAGSIIVHPFDKIYNFQEYDTGKDVKPEKEVYCVEKLNGFLGCISKHPFRNEILVSTTGSLKSDFVDYIKDFIDEKTTSNLLNYFKNNNKTLMFEVIHPKDTENHIVPYKDEELGLWLIGARERKLSAKPDSEESLDKIAKKLDFRRPKWEKMKFSEVLEKVEKSELEGYMVRDAQTDDTLMKIKTNYYLVTKFVGRMAPKKVEMMFKAPEKFKETHMEEEFYSLVDSIVKNTSQEKFEQMLQPERVSFVRDLIIQERTPSVSKKISI